MTIRDEVTTNLDAQYQSPEMRLWPRYDTPDDLDAIEAVPTHEPVLPATPNAVLIAHCQPGTTLITAPERRVPEMQFMILFTRHPDKDETPAPAGLREAEFEKVRGLYTDGLVQQIWLRGDAGGACMIVEAPSPEEVAAQLNALPLVRAGFLQPPMIVPLKPYSGFAPR
jgi:muconolactone delta-isomerase